MSYIPIDKEYNMGDYRRAGDTEDMSAAQLRYAAEVYREDRLAGERADAERMQGYAQTGGFIGKGYNIYKDIKDAPVNQALDALNDEGVPYLKEKNVGLLKGLLPKSSANVEINPEITSGLSPNAGTHFMKAQESLSKIEAMDKKVPGMEAVPTNLDWSKLGALSKVGVLTSVISDTYKLSQHKNNLGEQAMDVAGLESTALMFVPGVGQGEMIFRALKSIRDIAKAF